MIDVKEISIMDSALLEVDFLLGRHIKSQYMSEKNQTGF